MKLHELKPDKGSVKRKQRIGRGHAAGQGKTGGRGTKGQGARGNSLKRQYFEGGQLSLVRRLPFRRGFNNLFKIHYQQVNVEQLETLEPGTVVTPELLEGRGFIRDAEKPVVILGSGELSKKLTVHAHRFSKSAAQKIADAGGSTEQLALLLTGARATIKKLTKTQIAALKARQQQS
jgi:large subunit ribosomal protein L15